MGRPYPDKERMMFYDAVDGRRLYLITPVKEFLHIGFRGLHKLFQGIQHVEVALPVGFLGLSLQLVRRSSVGVGSLLFVLHHILGSLHDELLRLEIVLHPGGLLSQLPARLVDIEVQISIFFKVGMGLIGPVQQSVDEGRLVAEGGFEIVLVFFQLKGPLIDVVARSPWV